MVWFYDGDALMRLRWFPTFAFMWSLFSHPLADKQSKHQSPELPAEWGIVLEQGPSACPLQCDSTSLGLRMFTLFAPLKPGTVEPMPAYGVTSLQPQPGMVKRQRYGVRLRGKFLGDQPGCGWPSTKPLVQNCPNTCCRCLSF